MNKLIAVFLLFSVLMGLFPISIVAQDDSIIIRDDDFEGYNLGALHDGKYLTPYNPLNPTDTTWKNRSSGIQSLDGTYWFRGTPTPSGRGGFSTDCSGGTQANIVNTKTNNNIHTKAVQIMRPLNVSGGNATFQLFPSSSFKTSQYIYQTKLRNGGSAGKSADPGYTPRIKNGFQMAKFGPITLDFSTRSLIFEQDLTINPPVTESKIYENALPENAVWFDFSVEFDTVANKVIVSINNKIIGEQTYIGKTETLSSSNPRWYFVNGVGENAIYFDEVSVKITNDSEEKIIAKKSKEALAKLQQEIILFVGSNSSFVKGTQKTIDENQLVKPFIESEITYIPLRFLCDSLNLPIKYSDDKLTIEDKNNNYIFSPQLNSLTINDLVSSEKILVNEPLKIIEDRFYISANLFANLFGKNIILDESGVIIIGDRQFILNDEEKLKTIPTILSLFPEASLGFEINGIWRTEADIAVENNFSESDLAISDPEWEGITSYEKAYSGLKLSTNFVKEGKYSGKWSNKNYYPTIATKSIPTDCSIYNTLSFYIYSDKVTNEHIAVGLKSNSEVTPTIGQYTTNFYYYNININFIGWKKFELPLEDFQTFGNVQGLNKIDGLYFYTKDFYNQPNPETTIYLDAIKFEKLPGTQFQELLEKDAELLNTKKTKETSPKPYITDVPDAYKKMSLLDYLELLDNKKNEEVTTGIEKERLSYKNKNLLDKYNIIDDKNSYSDFVEYSYLPNVTTDSAPIVDINLNHNQAEFNEQIENGKGIEKQPYFKNERALYGYFPKFIPSPISIDQKGNIYSLINTTVIQVVSASGHVYLHDIKLQLDKYIKKQFNLINYRYRDEGFYNEVAIRFDKEGEAYLLAMIQGVNDKGVTIFKSLLLHSKDNLKTWDITTLPKAMARFERIDGFNTAANEYPPVILLHNHWVNKIDSAGYMYVPSKDSNGNLNLGELVKLNDTCTTYAIHSGNGNFAFSIGDKIYTVYSIVYPGKLVNGQIIWEKDKPVVPIDHPVNELTFNKPKFTRKYSEGAPTYIREYDRKTGKLSDSVYIGSGGVDGFDFHNWPAMTIDDEGYIHVEANGHHDPLYYVKSKRPYDITEWESPKLLPGQLSYASLTTDREGTLYTFNRDSARSYRNDLVLLRKQKNKDWEKITIVKNARRYYDVYRHNVTLNPENGYLYMHYFSLSSLNQLFKDEWDAKDFSMPDQSKVLGGIPEGTTRMTAKKYFFGGTSPHGEPVLLISKDGGSNWEFASVMDLAQK